MNTLKRFSALMLCLIVLVACFSGCHEKNEVAVTIGDVEFTSGYYACALFYADSEARENVNAQLGATATTATEIDYAKYKVENTDYVKWVKDTAISTLKQIAYIRSECKKADITLDKETAESAKLQADYQWETIGTQLEKNGIGKETFAKYIADLYLEDTYFEHLYGKGGTKEIKAEDIRKQLGDHYAIANILTADFSKLKSNEQDKKREDFKKYEEELKKDATKFEEFYKVENGEHSHDEATDGQKLPKDLHAALISDTNDNLSYENYSLEDFDTVKKMKTGEVKLITLKDDAGLLLLVKKDIFEDPYYLEEYDATIRAELKQEEFTKNISEQSKKLTADINDFAVNRFDVKKITYQ